MEEDQFDESDLSKTQLKKLATELQGLGQQLTAFKISDLDRLPLSDRLRSAVVEFKRLPNSHGAKRRQLQFIGKLMRSIDPEPISRSLAALDKQHRNHTAAFHRIEAARDDLRSRGDDAIGDILSIWPKAEVSWLRQWVRQHPRELARGNERAHSRKLHRYLTELADSASEET